MKSLVFWLTFHWNLIFLRVQLTLTEHLDYGLASNTRQGIIWTNADPINRRIYAALEGDETLNVTKISE